MDTTIIIATGALCVIAIFSAFIALGVCTAAGHLERIAMYLRKISEHSEDEVNNKRVNVGRHGTWQTDNTSDVHSSGKYRVCSECKESTFILYSPIGGSSEADYNYCPQCGAKMIGAI